MEVPKTHKCVGVAICDFSKDGFTALEWVHDFGIKLPTNYKLCVIFIQQNAHPSPGAQRVSIPDISPLADWGTVEAALGYKAGKQAEQAEQAKQAEQAEQVKQAKQTTKTEFQRLAGGLKEHVFGKAYEGPSIQNTVEFAIKDLQPGLDTLIVAIKDLQLQAAGQAAGLDTQNVHASGSSQIKLPIEPLELPEGCSMVVVAKTDGNAWNTVRVGPKPAPQKQKATGSGAKNKK